MSIRTRDSNVFPESFVLPFIFLGLSNCLTNTMDFSTFLRFSGLFSQTKFRLLDPRPDARDHDVAAGGLSPSSSTVGYGSARLVCPSRRPLLKEDLRDAPAWISAPRPRGRVLESSSIEAIMPVIWKEAGGPLGEVAEVQAQTLRQLDWQLQPKVTLSREIGQGSQMDFQQCLWRPPASPSLLL